MTKGETASRRVLADPPKKKIPQDLLADGPRSVEIENAVIAGALWLKDAAATMLDLVDSLDFTQSEARVVYRTIKRLVADGQPTDQTSVVGKLHETGRLTREVELFVATCDVNLPSDIQDIEPLARQLRSLTTRRQTMENAVRAFLDARDSEDEAGVIVQRNQERLGRPLTRLFRATEWVRFGELVTEYEEREPPEEGKLPMLGPSWGLRCLDELTGGLPAGDLILAAGRPGMAKTAFGCNVSAAAADAGCVCGVFSLEMARAKMSMRYLTEQLGVSHSDVRFKRLSREHVSMLERLKPVFEQWRLFFSFDPAQHIAEIRAKSRALRLKESRLDVVVVDYIQLVRGDGRNKEQEVNNVAEGLKHLAKEMDCCVLAMCQLNRDPEKRDDKRPRLADLRDSGGLEQHADLVLGLYRPVYYDPQTEEGDRAIIRILKQRDGQRGDLELFFDEKTQDWYEDSAEGGKGRRSVQQELL